MFILAISIKNYFFFLLSLFYTIKYFSNVLKIVYNFKKFNSFFLEYIMTF